MKVYGNSYGGEVSLFFFLSVKTLISGQCTHFSRFNHMYNNQQRMCVFVLIRYYSGD